MLLADEVRSLPVSAADIDGLLLLVSYLLPPVRGRDALCVRTQGSFQYKLPLTHCENEISLDFYLKNIWKCVDFSFEV